MRAFLVALVAGAVVAGGYLLTPGSSSSAAPEAHCRGRTRRRARSALRGAAHRTRVGHVHQLLRLQRRPARVHPEQRRPAELRLLTRSTRLGKGGRLQRGGLVSMETPVVYFYTDRDTKVTLKVDFPKGWITEWYPFAHSAELVGHDRRAARASAGT